MKKLDLTHPLIVAFFALICGALWGSAAPCIKIGYELFQIPAADISGRIVFAGFRFVIAGVMTIVFGSLLSREVLFPKKGNFRYVFLLCMVQTVLQYVFFYTGLAHASGVKSAIINASNSFITILIAVYIFRFEKMTRNKLLGGILCFAGVILINVSGGDLDATIHLNGEGSLLLSTTFGALAACMIKLFSRYENSVTLSGYQFFVGGWIMVAIGKLMGGTLSPVGPSAYILLSYMGFISAVAYTLWGILLKYNPVAKVAVYGFMNPLFGVVFAAFLLGETSQAFGPKGIIALALVCLGIYTVNRVSKE